jgi:hypothetical protein
MLCRTIADTNGPLEILDPACAVSEQDKKLGFVPAACKSGKSWVRGEGDKNPSRYASLPLCQQTLTPSAIIDEDVRQWLKKRKQQPQ